jgi:hypothetical protein
LNACVHIYVNVKKASPKTMKMIKKYPNF